MFDRIEKQEQFKFYARHIARLAIPRKWFQSRRDEILRAFDSAAAPALLDRVHYYVSIDTPFKLSENVRPFRLNWFGKRTVYQLDLHEHLFFFDPRYRLAWEFGDLTQVPTEPTFVKSRPLHVQNRCAILFKLNTLRHYRFVDDKKPYPSKLNKLVWRGNAAQPQRKEFLRKFFDHPDCDVGHFHRHHRDPSWWRPYLSIEQQLDYKFILSIEGNDVATSLKWILASNSLCFMCRPKYETWFMEGRLLPNVHYVALQSDYADLPEKIEYYRQNPKQAEAIIHAANKWVEPFRNRRQERAVALLVLWKYFHLTGQCEAPPL